MLDVSQSTVRSHLRRAQQKVMLELERQEAIQRVKDEREGRRRIDESGGLA
jgi:DNA-binding transcriptional ArsR family regulator